MTAMLVPLVLRGGERMCDAVREQGAVRQAGHGVVERLVLERLLGERGALERQGDARAERVERLHEDRRERRRRRRDQQAAPILAGGEREHVDVTDPGREIEIAVGARRQDDADVRGGRGLLEQLDRPARQGVFRRGVGVTSTSPAWPLDAQAHLARAARSAAAPSAGRPRRSRPASCASTSASWRAGAPARAPRSARSA